MASLLVTASCGGQPSGSSVPSVDTLQSGAIAVHNSLPDTHPTFELVEELRIGRTDGVGPDVFGEIRDLAVDPAGRLYVLDFAAKELRTFDASGRHLWTVGRPGRGPGEFSFPLGVTFDPQGRAWVADAGTARYSVFSDGKLVEEHPRDVVAGIVPWVGGFDEEGRLWDSFETYTIETGDLVGVVRLDASLVPTDSLLAGPVEEEVFEAVVGDRRTQAHIPFTPWMAWELGSRGDLFVGDGLAYELRQLRLNGDTVRIIRRSYDPIRVQAAEMDQALADLEAYRRRGGTVDRSRIPNVKPAIRALFVGHDARVWTYLHIEGDALDPGPRETRFDVFAADGTLLGIARAFLRLEPYTPAPVFTSGHVYAIAVDDLGVQSVVRFRIE